MRAETTGASTDGYVIFVQVGLMDVDICGPSVPRIMGLEGEQVG